MGKRRLEKVKAWAASARSPDSPPKGEDPKIKTSELPKGKFLVTAVLPDGKESSVDLFEYLDLVDVHSISEVSYVHSSTHFPPVPYSETGRGSKPYPPYYAGLGSGSAVLGLNNGDTKALSAIFTLDMTGHMPEHVNVIVAGWPVREFGPDNTKQIGAMHHLPANVDITLRIADGSKIEKRDVVRPQTQWHPRVE